MSVLSINHVSFIIRDCKKSADFYYQVLGLESDKNRPDLAFPGLWYQLGEQQLHLLQVDNPYTFVSIPEHGGRDRHLALNVDNLREIELILTKMQIAYSTSKSGRKALFCKDPDNNVLELIQV
ncbi:MAG: VOC family protein [Pseudomonadota bacterium]